MHAMHSIAVMLLVREVPVSCWVVSRFVRYPCHAVWIPSDLGLLCVAGSATAVLYWHTCFFFYSSFLFFFSSFLLFFFGSSLLLFIFSSSLLRLFPSSLLFFCHGVCGAHFNLHEALPSCCMGQCHPHMQDMLIILLWGFPVMCYADTHGMLCVVYPCRAALGPPLTMYGIALS